jgi:transglutaminase-like putative cysteine protease
MRLGIRHETVYSYSSPFVYTIQQLRLTPRPDGQSVERWHIDGPGKLESSIDPFGNRMHSFALNRPSSLIRVIAEGLVETAPLDHGRVQADARDSISPHVFTVPGYYTEADEQLRDFARSNLPARPKRDDLQALSEAIGGRILYESGATVVTSTAAQAIALGRGVCQDLSHVYIAACHVMDVPCRYVSGYFFPGDSDELASHAWVDVWLQGEGESGAWISVDPTHKSFASDRHVRLALGRDYETAAPIRGVRAGGGEEKMTVSVSVVPQ